MLVGLLFVIFIQDNNIMSTVLDRPQRDLTFKTHFRQPEFRGEAVPVQQSDNVSLGLMLGASQHMHVDQDIKLYHLCVLDLDAENIPLTAISMPFFGHGIVPNPVNPELVSIFEKRGKGACEIDLKQGSVTRIIETEANREFYGHGAYSPDGELLYCTETIVEGKYDGVIAVRDARTHRYLGEFPSYGSSPHDCHLIDNGTTMVVANGGGPVDGSAPNVSYIDVRTQKLIEKLEFDSPHINAGHLDITSTGKLAVVSAQREGLPEKALGGISLKLGENAGLHTLRQPAQVIEHLYAESLSVCIDERSGTVGVTTPAGNLVTFWDINTGELLHYYLLPNPRGIELSRNGKCFVISYGQGEPAEAIGFVSTVSLEHVQGYDLIATGITGSHLTSYSLPPELRH